MTNCLNSPQQNDHHHHHQKDDSFFGSLLAGTLYFFPSFSCSSRQDVCVCVSNGIRKSEAVWHWAKKKKKKKAVAIELEMIASVFSAFQC